MIQTAEGALTEINNMVVRIRELTVQAANDTNAGNDRLKIAEEVAQLLNEIDATSARTEFNTKKIIGADANDLNFQIGANQNQSLEVTFSKVDTANTLNILSANAANNNALATVFNLTGGAAAAAGNITAWEPPANANNLGADYNAALGELDAALEAVTSQRAKYGANQNRLEHTINNLNTSSENLNAARSRIEDADMAKEMMNLTSANVLQQAATSMLAQANQAPNNITQLLG